MFKVLLQISKLLQKIFKLKIWLLSKFLNKLLQQLCFEEQQNLIKIFLRRSISAKFQFNGKASLFPEPMPIDWEAVETTPKI